MDAKQNSLLEICRHQETGRVYARIVPKDDVAPYVYTDSFGKVYVSKDKSELDVVATYRGLKCRTFLLQYRAGQLWKFPRCSLFLDNNQKSH